MPVVFDAATEGSRTTEDPFTFTHTPVGIPKAIVVIASQNSFSSDSILSMTYGGVAMNADVTQVADALNEPGSIRVAFLGRNIPTGGQTVSVVFGGGTTPHWIVAMSFTADSDTEVVFATAAGTQVNRADPQETLITNGRLCVGVGGLFSGTAAVPVGTLLTGMSRVHDHDWGAQVSTVDRQTAASISDFLIGYTLTSDDAAYAAIAISEILSSPTIITAAARMRASHW